ncbi:hypothetical protein [Streptomyces sp. NPDC060194]|uniref:hypothetical protein n=1 Tax=Streptomyces sp. NPDC060194 TaxID=3347069 RepID=UPI003647C467
MPATAAAPAVAPPPFLMTPSQGGAARQLLSWVAALPLESPDAQLLALTVGIRAARAGVGNVSGQDLRMLRLDDVPAALDALAGLGWRNVDTLRTAAPETPVPVEVPELEPGREDRPLRFGKEARSRASGWSVRTLTAKPVRKASVAARLAALFVAAHSRSDLRCSLPPELPAHCLAALPELVAKGFVAESADGSYVLQPVVRHLSGRVPTPEELRAAEAAPRPAGPSYEEWKAGVSPALRRHVEAVEGCTLCAMPLARVSEAFLGVMLPEQASTKQRLAYEAWRQENPAPGPHAARTAAAFRAEHGHGPSVKQFCEAAGWRLKGRPLRGLVIAQLLAEGWLTNTAPVPWTLRPGRAAGIATPRRATPGERVSDG